MTDAKKKAYERMKGVQKTITENVAVVKASTKYLAELGELYSELEQEWRGIVLEAPLENEIESDCGKLQSRLEAVEDACKKER